MKRSKRSAVVIIASRAIAPAAGTLLHEARVGMLHQASG